MDAATAATRFARRRTRIDSSTPVSPLPDSGLQTTCRELQKKLRFLEGLRELIASHGRSPERMFDGVVRLLPLAWRHPEICCAQAILGETSYATPNWRNSPWMISAEIHVHGKAEGRLQVAYLSPLCEGDQDPFTRDEKSLLDFTSTLLGKTAERQGAIAQLQETVRQLESQRTELQQANAALRGIFNQIDEERQLVRRAITANVEKVVMPIVQALQSQAAPHQQPLVALLKKRLEEITSPFADHLSRAFASLTPLEVGICQMIRDNLSTKEIARIRHVSPSTVARQREQIRRKLGITGSDANLATYLRTCLTTAGQPARTQLGQ